MLNLNRDELFIIISVIVVLALLVWLMIRYLNGSKKAETLEFEEENAVVNSLFMRLGDIVIRLVRLAETEEQFNECLTKIKSMADRSFDSESRTLVCAGLMGYAEGALMQFKKQQEALQPKAPEDGVSSGDPEVTSQPDQG